MQEIILQAQSSDITTNICEGVVCYHKGSIIPNCSCNAPKDILGLSVYQNLKHSNYCLFILSGTMVTHSVVKTTNFIVQCMQRPPFKWVKCSFGRGLNVFGFGLESHSGNIDSGQTIQTSLLDYQRLICNTHCKGRKRHSQWTWSKHYNLLCIAKMYHLLVVRKPENEATSLIYSPTGPGFVSISPLISSSRTTTAPTTILLRSEGTLKPWLEETWRTLAWDEECDRHQMFDFTISFWRVMTGSTLFRDGSMRGTCLKVVWCRWIHHWSMGFIVASCTCSAATTNIGSMKIHMATGKAWPGFT